MKPSVIDVFDNGRLAVEIFSIQTVDRPIDVSYCCFYKTQLHENTITQFFSLGFETVKIAKMIFLSEKCPGVNGRSRFPFEICSILLFLTESPRSFSSIFNRVGKITFLTLRAPIRDLCFNFFKIFKRQTIFSF